MVLSFSSFEYQRLYSGGSKTIFVNFGFVPRQICPRFHFSFECASLTLQSHGKGHVLHLHVAVDVEIECIQSFVEFVIACAGSGAKMGGGRSRVSVFFETVGVCLLSLRCGRGH